ncbi:hypothetical protein RND81_11G141300 [Saponaria officinalis]|uniref:Protein EXECUTER 1, chloroplastic n=1 Tax=Saponaria officinalis TaxID=3572 RepID=A0AAW1HM01_SAPOF
MISSPISPSPPFSPPSISSDSHRTTTAPLSSFSFKPPFLRKSHSLCCRSSSSSGESPSPPPSPSPFRQFFAAAAQMLDNFVNSRSSTKDVEIEEKGGKLVDEIVDVDDWDWERWQSHFLEIDEQERLINLLKMQISDAIAKEDYDEAARLKVAVAAAATKDAVGSVISFLKNAIEEERYQDAIFVRDNAGAGLVGWWAGFSDDKSDPYGCIIRISAEHGRYVARSYSPRQLATSATGAPLFEIFLTLNSKGEYKQKSSAASSSMKMGPGGGKTDIFAPVIEDEDDEDKDDPDTTDGFPGFQNVLQDMIPGVKVKVLKVTTPQKVDQDLISKVVEQIIEEDDDDDDDKDFELELDDEDGGDTDDTEDGMPGDSDGEKDEGGMEAAIGNMDMGDQSEISVKVVVKGDIQKLSSKASSRELVRVPAKLKSKGRKSFSFSVQDGEDKPDSTGKDQISPKTKSKLQGSRGIEHVMSDLVNSLSRGEKVPVKVLKDIGDLISVSISQARNRQPLSGSTTFSRIDLPSYPDPLNGLYIGSHGPFSSEVIHLKRKFGQWKDDGGSNGPSDLRFYEYVEAVKLTGDPYVPAGQVAFRAKVGSRYQLPHKGIIPEEFGVVARYKGQGRLAEPGFKKPRWVDGELVILDGKLIKSGPVVGFVYWAPEYQFLVFFNRLRIQD